MTTIIPGAEPLSHAAGAEVGVLVLHGFTGNPGSMRGLAEACAAAGFDVEMPLLAGHGTRVEDMVPTRWADWSADANAAYERLASRCGNVVVAGLSMGGSLTLWLGAEHPEIRGLVCVNPATTPIDPGVLDALRGMVDSGQATMDAIGSDIADPDAVEASYPATPLEALLSMQIDGLVPLSARYGAITCPLLLFTSPQDHVVTPEDSERLAAAYGGPVERVALERSYHVATMDHDKQLIFDRTVEFVARVGHGAR
jgi:carboxylesterase